MDKVLYRPICLVNEGVRMYSMLLLKHMNEDNAVPDCLAALLIMKSEDPIRLSANRAVNAYDIEPLDGEFVECLTIIEDPHFGNTLQRRMEQMTETKSKRAYPINPETAMQFHFIVEYENDEEQKRRLSGQGDEAGEKEG